MGSSWRAVAAGAAVAAAFACLAVPSAASAQSYAPVGTPGPPLSVPASQLAASLDCSPGLAGATSEPVLLVPGTGVTPEKNFSWNWIPALDALGKQWCTVELPGSSMQDIQIAGEHVVNAIRAMNAATGRRVDVLGHSQGGMVPRWALRFWPDTRGMVDDQIGMAPSNHGTDTAGPLCAGPGGCAAAAWQQRSGSEFIKALNSFQETFVGVDYTAIYTHNDTVVTPNLDDTGSSSLRPGDGPNITNVAVQDICPLDPADHLAAGTSSNTVYALAIDAMDNPGPADPARVPAVPTCATPLMPGVNPLTHAADAADAGQHLLNSYATAPRIAAEPPLACYVFAACASSGAAIPGTVRSAKGLRQEEGQEAEGRIEEGEGRGKKKGKKRRGCKPKKRKRKKRR